MLGPIDVVEISLGAARLTHDQDYLLMFWVVNVLKLFRFDSLKRHWLFLMQFRCRVRRSSPAAAVLYATKSQPQCDLSSTPLYVFRELAFRHRIHDLPCFLVRP